MDEPNQLLHLRAEVRRLADLIDMPDQFRPQFDMPADADNGDYIKIEDGKYVFIRTEPFGQFESVRTDDLDEFFYHVFSTLTFGFAECLSHSHKDFAPDTEVRRAIWPVQLGLMEKLSPAWRRKLKEEIEETIRKYPPGDGKGDISLRPIKKKINEEYFNAPAPKRTFLEAKLESHDAVRMRVIDVQGQTVVGNVEHVYSRRFEGPTKYEQGNITFVGSTSAWGNECLRKGELALVFLAYRTESGRYYQHHWQGHFSIVDRNNETYALANWPMLEGKDPEPDELRSAAFPWDPEASRKAAIPYHVVEKLLLQTLSTFPEIKSRNPWQSIITYCRKWLD